MGKLLLISAAITGCTFAADPETAIRTTFVKPWVQAVTSGRPEALKRLLHPKVQACMNDETSAYLNESITRDLRGARGGYEVTRLAPWKGPAPLWALPADGFFYPVQPSYELNVQFAQGNTVVIRYLAAANGSWYEVQPCPNEKGMAFMRESIAQANQQKQRAAELAAQVKDPLLGDLMAILKQHRITDAARKYQEATGLDDFTVAVLVMNILDPEHPLGRHLTSK